MIVERHYDEETLIGLLANGQTGETARDPHLSVCTSCAEILESYRAVALVLGADSVWDLRQLTSSPDQNTLSALRSFRSETQLQDVDAAALLEGLLARPQASWIDSIKRDLRYHNAAVVRALVERSETLIDTMPPDSLATARAAVEAAQLIDSSESSDAVRKAQGAAWRQYAYTLFYVGEISRAFDAVERSRAIFEQCSISEYDLARVGIVRALVYGMQERYDEALAVASESIRVFRAWGDGKRLASALSSQAHILIVQGRYREALPILQEVEDDFKTLIGSNERATVIGNIALCYSQTGRISEALNSYQIAAAIHEEAGTRTEAARIRFNVADLLAQEGRHQEAADRLRRVRAEFQSLGMDYPAACAGLNLAELLLVEARGPEAEQLCRTAIAQFERTGLVHTTTGLVALTYLREALAQHRATPEVVRHVRKYIERLPNEPQLLFVEPPLARG